MPAPATINQVAAQYQAALQVQDEQARVQLVRAWASAYAGIEQQLQPIITAIDSAVAAGTTPAKAAIAQRAQLEKLAAVVATEITGFGQLAEQVITGQQLSAIQLAAKAVPGMTLSAMGEKPTAAPNFQKPNAAAFSHLVGTLADGSPLRALLDAYGTEASAHARRVLLDGLAQGKPYRGFGDHTTSTDRGTVAGDLADATGMPLARARVIAQTELMRVYRMASIGQMQLNPALIYAWEWRSACNARTCAACWAMHGTIHPLDEPMDGHPGCRCVPVPVTRTWEELGFGTGMSEPQRGKSGIDRFADLEPADQRQILGKTRYEAYSTGTLSLTDMVARRAHPQWGTMRHMPNLATSHLIRDGQLPSGYANHDRSKLASLTPTPNVLDMAMQVKAAQLPPPAPAKPPVDKDYQLVSSTYSDAKKKAKGIADPHAAGEFMVATAQGILTKAQASGSAKAVALAQKKLQQAEADLAALGPKGPSKAELKAAAATYAAELAINKKAAGLLYPNDPVKAAAYYVQLLEVSLVPKAQATGVPALMIAASRAVAAMSSGCPPVLVSSTTAAGDAAPSTASPTSSAISVGTVSTTANTIRASAEAAMAVDSRAIAVRVDGIATTPRPGTDRSVRSRSR